MSAGTAQAWGILNTFALWGAVCTIGAVWSCRFSGGYGSSDILETAGD